MHWFLYVLIGATINVAVNAGYKVLGGSDNMLFMAASVMAVSSLGLFSYAFLTKTGQVVELLSGNTPWVVLGMGAGGSIVLVLFITALTKGQISLVDPLWACIYALVSVVVGVFLFRETPGVFALSGIALYLLGAFLMIKGSS